MRQRVAALTSGQLPGRSIGLHLDGCPCGLAVGWQPGVPRLGHLFPLKLTHLQTQLLGCSRRLRGCRKAGPWKGCAAWGVGGPWCCTHFLGGRGGSQAPRMRPPGGHWTCLSPFCHYHHPPPQACLLSALLQSCCLQQPAQAPLAAPGWQLRAFLLAAPSPPGSLAGRGLPPQGIVAWLSFS